MNSKIGLNDPAELNWRFLIIKDTAREETSQGLGENLQKAYLKKEYYSQF